MRPCCIVLSIALAVAGARSALSFEQQGDGAGDCQRCHTLTKEEAGEILKELVQKILNVEASEVPGLWVVDAQVLGGRRVPIYLDYSKQYAFSGNLLEIATRENLTQDRVIDLNRIDFSKIPLEDAVLIGDPSADNKIAVFTDPDCPYCRKLHAILEEVVERRKDVAFYVKMYSINKKSYEKAKAIACAKSRQMLDDAMAGKEVSAPSGCESIQLEANLALGRSIGVRSTPTLVFSDGRVFPGAKPAAKILELLDEAQRSQTAGAGGPD